MVKKINDEQLHDIANRVRRNVQETWRSLGMQGEPPRIGEGMVRLVLRYAQEVLAEEATDGS